MAVSPYRWRSPDARLRDLRYARQVEEARSAGLDEEDARRQMQIDQAMQREQARSADLDRRDDIGRQVEVEEARSADLDRREAGMQQFREVERRRQPPGREPFRLPVDILPVPGDPSFEPPQRPQAIPLGLGTFLQPGETMPPLTAPEARAFGAPEPTRAAPFRESLFGTLAPYLQRGLSEKEAALAALEDIGRRGGYTRQPTGEEVALRDALTTIVEGAPASATGQSLLGETLRVGYGVLEREPLLGGPLARTSDEGFPVYDPEGRTAFERGAELSRPVARPILTGVAAPFEAGEMGFEEVTGVPARGVVSGKIKGQIAEDVLTEIINPAALVLIAPLAMQGTQGLRGLPLAAQMGSNLLGTGMEPALVRGTLRGLTALSTRGVAALRTMPRAVRESPMIQGAVRGIREGGEAGGPRVPGGRFRPTAPEGIRLTNDLPTTTAIRQRLTEIDAELAKPSVKGGRPAMLAERARLQAQADIDEILASGLPVEEQFRAVEAELEGLRIELQTRGLPFRGRWTSRKFVPQEKDMPMGGLSAEERAAHPSAAQSAASRAARAEQRYPGLSTGEVNARERVYAEFVESARFEPVEEAARKLQPWEMTQAEYVGESGLGREPVKARDITGTPLDFAGDLRRTHRQYVEVALRRGESVSPEVLKDYPDLARVAPEAPVGRARFTPEGETIREPTYATEGELGGVRARQGELGIGPGERPIETAGPMFEQADVTARPAGQRSVEPTIDTAKQTDSFYAPPPGRAGLSFDALPEQAASAAQDDIARVAAAEGIPPPRNPPPPLQGRGGMGPPEDPEGWLAAWLDRSPSEAAGRAYARKFAGFRSVEGREMLNAYQEAKNLRARLHIPTGPKRTPEKELFVRVLHGEADVAELPENYRQLYNHLQARKLSHESRILNVDPAFERRLIPDYWPRQFKPRDGGSFLQRITGRLRPGERPGFMRQRKYSSLEEALGAGEDLKTWDSVDQWFLRESEGVEYIYTKIVADASKREGLVIPRSAAPDDWVPLPYRAFESRPFVAADGTLAWSEPLVADKEFATWLRRMFGDGLEKGANIEDILAFAAGTTKRLKVIGGLFQHIDLSFRAVSRAYGRAATAFATGDVATAYRQLRVIAAVPRAWGEAFVPPLRSAAAKMRLKNPIIKEGIDEGLQLEGGLDIAKRTIRVALDPDEIQRFPILGDIPIPEKLVPLKVAQRRLNDVANWLNGGLYDAVHPRLVGATYESIWQDVRRANPAWTSRQVSANAGEATNIIMSAIPDWQSVLNPRLRQFARGVFFSPNETEAWFRQFFGALYGQHAGIMRTQWLGYMLTAFTLAEAINLAFTGRPLGLEQLVPIERDSNGGVRYNTRFMRPKITGDGPAGRLTNLAGPLGQELYLDLLGQADTPFRWVFSPSFAVMSRLSPPFSTAIQLLVGERFFGEKELDTTTQMGPFAVPSREALGFAGEQLAGPIPATGFMQERERIGVSGAVFQAAGINVSAENFGELLRRAYREETGKDWETAVAAVRNRDIRDNPRLSAIVAAADKSARKYGSAYQRVEDAVANAGLLVEMGENMDGGPDSLAVVASAIRSGETGEDVIEAYGKKRQDFFTARESVRGSERQRLGLTDQDFPDPKTREQRLVGEYYELEPEDTNGNGFIDSEDVRFFFAARDQIKAQLKPETVTALDDPAKFFTEADVIWVEEERLRAIEQLKQVQALPRFVGLTVAQGDAVVELTVEGGVVERVRAEQIRQGKDPAPAFEILMSLARQRRERGDKEGSDIALYAALRQRESFARDLMNNLRSQGKEESARIIAGLIVGNPERDDLIAKSEELRLFWPGFARALSEEQRAFLEPELVPAGR